MKTLLKPYYNPSNRGSEYRATLLHSYIAMYSDVEIDGELDGDSKAGLTAASSTAQNCKGKENRASE